MQGSTWLYCELDGVATLVADPPDGTLPLCQNHPFNQIDVTVLQILRF